MSMTPPPYLTTVKNLPAIFAKIKSAGTPPKFNVEFLKSSLGFASSGDRAVVPQLKFLKFLDDNNAPTERYNQYRGAEGEAVLAQALKEAYSDVFLANENANSLGDKELKDLFASLTGKGDAIAQKMATTFKALSSLADFSKSVEKKTDDTDITDDDPGVQQKLKPQTTGLNLNLKHDIHVHLPATSDVSVYKAIFRAINDELTD